MFYQKPIILIDFETSGLLKNHSEDDGASEPHELAAVYISNTTLEIESQFESEFKIYHPEFASKQSFSISDITLNDVINRKKTPEQAIKDFHIWIESLVPKDWDTKDKFKKLKFFNFASWNGVFDSTFLEKMYIKANMYSKYSLFDHHFLDLWSLFSCFRIMMGKTDELKGSLQALREMDLAELANDFKHRALGDCQSEALILTSVLKSLNQVGVSE